MDADGRGNRDGEESLDDDRPEPLTPEQQALFDGYLAEWATPMRLLNYKHGAKVRMALTLGYTREDIEQDALIGLMIAARRFDPSRGVQFNTFASYWLVSRLSHRLNYLTVQKRTIKNGHLVSGDSSNEEGGRTLFETVVQESGRVLDADHCLPLYAVLKTLHEHQRRVIEMRYGLNCPPHTLEEAGLVLGITRERVRQIEAVVMAKLWRRLRGTPLEKEAMGTDL